MKIQVQRRFVGQLLLFATAVCLLGASTAHATPAPDLSVTKTCAITAPQTVLCTVTVTNNGTMLSLTPMTLTDTVSGAPSNAQYLGAGGTLPLTCTPGAGPVLPIVCHGPGTYLSGGQQKNATFGFRLPTGGSFTNCASESQGTSPGVQPDPVPNNNTNICTTITVPGPGGPDVSATKSCVVNGPQSVLCTIIVTNNGTTPTVSPMSLSDIVAGAPADAIVTGAGGTLGIGCPTPAPGLVAPIPCTAITSLAAGVSKTALISFKLPTGGTMTNCVTVTTPQADPTPNNNTHICSTVTVPPPPGADLSVTKVCVVNGPQSVLCTVTVTNNGATATTSPLHIADLVSGAPADAVITGAGGTLPIGCSPGAGPITPISCNANTSILPGTANQKNALFSFKLPTGGTMTNCATVTTPQTDPTPANNTNICSTVTVPPPPGADLSVTKVCVVNGPQSVLCTVTVTNNGATATISPLHIADLVSGAPANAVITGAGGTLPIGCSPGAGPITPISCNANTSILPGTANQKNALFSFKLPTGGTMTNCATVTTPQTDPTPANNTNICSTVTVPPPAAPDVSATKSCVVNGPQSVLCTITVTNNGPGATASPMSLVDTVTGAPANAVSTGAGGNLGIGCPTPAPGLVAPTTCTAITSLAAGDTKTALLSYKLPTGGTMTNCVTVTTPQTDPTPANNTHICSTVTVPPPVAATMNFQIQKQFQGPAVPGTYTFHISCTGAYTGPSTINLVVPPNPSATSIVVPVGSTCTLTENQIAGWNTPIFGGSSQPLNPNLPWGVTIGPFQPTNTVTDRVLVVNRP